MTRPEVNISIKTKMADGERECVFSTNVLKYNIPLQEQILESDTKYVIKWNFDLDGGTINVPENCIFEFNGGKIYNGSIVWNKTKVLNIYGYNILENVEESGIRTTFGGEI